LSAALFETKDVFLVGVTGNMLSENTNYFRACGANTVFPKPFKMPDLEDLWVENEVLKLKESEQIEVNE